MMESRDDIFKGLAMLAAETNKLETLGEMSRLWLDGRDEDDDTFQDSPTYPTDGDPICPICFSTDHEVVDITDDTPPIYICECNACQTRYESL